MLYFLIVVGEVFLELFLHVGDFLDLITVPIDFHALDIFQQFDVLLHDQGQAVDGEVPDFDEDLGVQVGVDLEKLVPGNGDAVVAQDKL